MKAIEYFLQGAEGEEVRHCLLVGVLRDAISALADSGRSRLGSGRIYRFVFRRRNAEPDQEPMENEANGK